MRHDAQLRTVQKDGATWRAHLELAAKRGSADAIAKLQGPPFPRRLAYLYRWLLEVYGRSGATLDGLAPLSYPTLDAWARLCVRDPRPHEIEALFRLDRLLRHPED